MINKKNNSIGPARLLIVDDSYDTCSLLKEYFEGLGYAVNLAFNGQEALDNMKEFMPDIVLMDIQMPFMDGEACLKRLKLRFPGASVIVVTGLNNRASVEKFAELGAAGYVAKPIDMDFLSDLIQKLLKEKPE